MIFRATIIVALLSLNIHAPISLVVYKIVVEGFPAGEVALELLKMPPQTPLEIL